MRILRLIGVDPCQGGPTEGALQQTTLLAQMGIETHFASLESPDNPYVCNCENKVFAFGVGPMPSGWRRFLPWLYDRVAPNYVPWLKSHVDDYDLVIVHGLWNYGVHGAWRALSASQTPYVVFTHGMLDPWFKRVSPLKNLMKQISWWRCEGPLLAHAAAVLFTTEEECMLARNAFYPYRIKEKVINYGTADVPDSVDVQIAAFRALLPALENRSYILFLSRIHPKKGCDMLLEAFAGVAQGNADIDLVMAGPDQVGWVPALKRLAERLGISGRVHWPGMLTGDTKWGAFRGAEAFILPSHQENFGIAVAEAMAAETPVLISDKVNIWREIASEQAGMVRPDTPEGVRMLLQDFFDTDQQERHRMGKRARAAFLAHFEISRIMKVTATFFGSVAEGHAM